MREAHRKPFHRIGDTVSWKDRTGRIRRGIVREIYTHRVTHRGPDGLSRRQGSRHDPAYGIETLAGGIELRLHSDLIEE